MLIPKKLLTCLLSIGLLCSCNSNGKESESQISMKDTVIEFAKLPEVRLSSTLEVATTNGKIGYKMKVPYTDTYQINFKNSISKYSIYNYVGDLICESSEPFTTETLTKNEIVFVVLDGVTEGSIIETELFATNHKSVLPYDSEFKIDPAKLSTHGNPDESPLKPAEIKYVKRPDGTYINSNNPELLTNNDLNKALCRDMIEGEVFFTFEHNNGPTVPFYYGYQVKNPANHNLYVTIKNVGFQLDGPGSWLGEDEWIKFYNTKFTFDSSNWNESQMQEFINGYNFSNKYEPNNDQPITIVLPAGQQIYVMGGTTRDSYLNFNAFNTANKTVKGGCSNAAVLFNVAGGKALGSYYVYTNPGLINTESEQQGYVIERDGKEFGAQYIGRDTCNGVVENETMWTFNDRTLPQKLPVTFKNYYKDNVAQTGTPYSEIKSTEHTQRLSYWATHLNPQSGSRDVVGTDMTRYITVDSVTRKPIVIDANHYDGRGRLANIGNWMIDYQDRFTFVNQGEKERTITLALKDNGSCAVMVLDANGNILDKKYTISRIEQFPYYFRNNPEMHSYLYDLKVPAHSIIQITLEYNLLANSSGYLKHTVYLK